MTRLLVFLAAVLFNGGLSAAMLPYIELEDIKDSFGNWEQLTIELTYDDSLEITVIELTNLDNNKSVLIGEGAYYIDTGDYLIWAYKPGLKEKTDTRFTQYKKQITVSPGRAWKFKIPRLKRRKIGIWYDFFTIALQTGTLSPDYEVSDILNEHYTASNIPNSFPETSSLGDNDSAAQNRTGFSINAKHLFANSSRLIYGELFSDNDGNQHLKRYGFSIGGGKYWAGKSRVLWVASGIGLETAEWNGIKLNSSSSTVLSGETTTESINLEAGIIYSPLNASVSAKLDIVNETIMLNLGYTFGGKKQSYLDSQWAN